MSEGDTRLIVEIGALALTVISIIAKLSALSTKFEMIGKQQAAEISELKDSHRDLAYEMKGGLKLIADAMLNVALQKQMIDSIAMRQDRLEGMVDELRHGRGMVQG